MRLFGHMEAPFWSSKYLGDLGFVKITRAHSEMIRDLHELIEPKMSS